MGVCRELEPNDLVVSKHQQLPGLAGPVSTYHGTRNKVRGTLPKVGRQLERAALRSGAVNPNPRPASIRTRTPAISRSGMFAASM